MEELERTYLAKVLPEGLLESPSKEMVDIYLPASAVHPHLRIRKAGEKYEITNKQPVIKGDASRQIESTIVLTSEEFGDLNLIPGKRVLKKRYYHTFEGRIYEVDVFEGQLSGLVLVDIEFESNEDKLAFLAPDFCLAEVTQEDFIAGGMLAGARYEDVEIGLAKFRYKKIIL